MNTDQDPMPEEPNTCQIEPLPNWLHHPEFQGGDEHLFTNPLDLEPAVLDFAFFQDDKGDHIFPRESICVIFGAPGSRKSTWMRTAVGDHLGIYIDLESSGPVISRELQRMGYDRTRTSLYAFPQDLKSLDTLLSRIAQMKPNLVVIDSFTGLGSLVGADLNSATDVQRLFTKYLFQLRASGHCVVILDHVAKNMKAQVSAIGSQNKMAQVDIAFGMKKEGEISEIEMVKDRFGAYRERGILDGTYGHLEIKEAPKRARVIRHDTEVIPLSKSKKARSQRLENLKQGIIIELEKSGKIGVERLKQSLGRSREIDPALKELITGGYVTDESGRDLEGNHCRRLLSRTDLDFFSEEDGWNRPFS